MAFLERGSQKSKFIINAMILIVSFVSISKRDLTYKGTTFFENLMIDTIAPIQSMFTSSKSSFSTFFSDYALNVDASRENRDLKKKIEEYQNKIFTMEEVKKENDRLKDLLGFGQQLQAKKVLAQVVSWDASSDFKVIRINKGVKHGVHLQAPVVTANGLVGYVYRLTDNFADILTIMDPNNKVDGLVKRVRAQGIVEGFNDNVCVMKYVTRTEPIILNDVVMTSGLGNIYPKGIKIGTVSKIVRESFGITQHIEVIPAVEFGKLEEVVVLIPDNDERKKLEWEALDGPINKDKSK